MAGLWSRIRGTSTWQDDFKKVSESGVIDVPKELLTSILEATNDADTRREIMRLVHSCLSEPASTKWRRIHAGLVVVVELVRKGNPLLLLETAGGHHFDLVQRLAFLEKFELTSDARVQLKIRTMANSIRKELKTKLETITVEGLKDDAGQDDVSLCSGVSKTTGSTITPVSSPHGFGSDDAFASLSFYKPARKIVVNGIVRVGHSDDTDSDSAEEQRGMSARSKQSVKAGQTLDVKAVAPVTPSIDLLAF